MPTGHDPLRDDAPELARTMAASVQQRIAFGERAGQQVRRIGQALAMKVNALAHRTPLCQCARLLLNSVRESLP